MAAFSTFLNEPHWFGGFGIHTECGTPAEFRHNIREAVDCYFDKRAWSVRT